MLGKFLHHNPPKADFNASALHNKPAQTPPKTIKIEEGSKLIVGPNIKLKGTEITDCEILVVEGRVEASMHSRDIHIAETGVFYGKAEIDVAEIRGRFEGEMTVRKRLTVFSTGKVTGKILYGALTIEEGGVLSGEISSLPAEEPAAKHEEPVRSALPVLPLAEIVHAPHPYRPPVLGRSPLGSRRS